MKSDRRTSMRERYTMRALRRLTTLCLGFSLVACADESVSPKSRTLTGNWGSQNYSRASFALTESNGKVTGHGWFYTGAPLSVSGTVSGADVSLTLSFLTRTGLQLPFHGVFENDALVGDIDGGMRISLARVDTVAEAASRINYSDGRTAIVEDATFLWADSTLYIDNTILFREQIRIFGTPGKLVTGKYTIGESGAPFKASIQTGDSDMFRAVSGEVTITAVGARAVIGAFSITFVKGQTPLNVTGTFSAACMLDYLSPLNPTCSRTIP